MKYRITFAAAALLALTGCSGTLIGENTTVTETTTVGEVTVTATTTMTQLIGAGAVATVTDAVAPAAPAPDAGQGTGAGAVGAPVTFDWQDATGAATVHTLEWRDSFGDTIVSTPDHGAFLILDVSVEGLTGEGLSYNTLYWTAKDAEGRTYDAELMAIGLEPAFGSGDLAVGEKARGFVAIDVPKVPLTLNLTSPLGTPVASWPVAP